MLQLYGSLVPSSKQRTTRNLPKNQTLVRSRQTDLNLLQDLGGDLLTGEFLR